MRRFAMGLFAAAACGGGSPAPNQIDAPAGDGAVDGSADANLGLASVLVQSSKHPSPVPGVPVLFTDLHGVSSEAHTDAMGQASGLIPPGGSVTTVANDSTYATIANAMPGDHLTFGIGRFFDAGNLTVSFTAYAQGTSYVMYSPCLRVALTPPTSTVSLELCNAPLTDTDVYLLAFSSTGNVTAAAHHVDLTSGAITVTEPWTPMRTIEVAYTGFTPAQALSTGSYDVPEDYNAGPGSHADPNVTLTVPATAPIQLITTDIEDQTFSSTMRSQSFVDRIAPTATTYALSAAELRPEITSISYDPATRTVSSTVPAGLAGDIVRYTLIWGTGPSTASVPHYWDIYAPAFEPFVLPVLPPDMHDYSLDPNQPLTLVVDLYDSSSVTSWDAARPHIFELTSNLPDPANVPDRMYLQHLSIQP